MTLKIFIGLSPNRTYIDRSHCPYTACHSSKLFRITYSCLKRPQDRLLKLSLAIIFGICSFLKAGRSILTAGLVTLHAQYNNVRCREPAIRLWQQAACVTGAHCYFGGSMCLSCSGSGFCSPHRARPPCRARVAVMDGDPGCRRSPHNTPLPVHSPGSYLHSIQRAEGLEMSFYGTQWLLHVNSHHVRFQNREDNRTEQCLTCPGPSVCFLRFLSPPRRAAPWWGH